MATANKPSRDMIIIWDFDRTIITDHSDRWVVLDTGLTKLFYRLRLTLSWNSLMGIVIDKIRDSDTKKRGIIYIGGGKDDLCPALKLSVEDHVMPKKNVDIVLHVRARPVISIIPINLKIHDWKDGEEFNSILIRLLSPQADTINQ